MNGDHDGPGPTGEKVALLIAWGIIALAAYGAASALGYLGGWVV